MNDLPPSESPRPVVSVVFLVYNHAPYVVQALESIFAQQLDFHVELLIGDDRSTDDSRARMDDFLAAHHHDRITVRRLYADTNLGMHGNTRRLLALATGRYIALLEGDDYWCDPRKLHKQASLLDRSDDCYLVAHATDFLWQNTGRIERKELRWNRLRTRFTVRDYLRQIFFHTSSIMMRNIGLRWPDWLDRVKQLDQFLVLLHATPQRESIRFIPEVMSVYRKHDRSISRSAEHQNLELTMRSMIEGLTRFDAHSHGRYARSIRLRIDDLRLNYAVRLASGWRRYAIRARAPVTYLRRLQFRLIRSL